MDQKAQHHAEQFLLKGALLFNLWLLMQVPADAAMSTLVALLVGGVLYLLARRAPVPAAHAPLVDLASQDIATPAEPTPPNKPSDPS